MSALCVYDARDTSDEVLADVRRVHSHLVGPAGEDRPNSEYLAPEAFLEDWSRTAADALEAGAPDVVSNDPTPADGRRAVTTVAAEASLDPDGLVSAVSELLANASEHGRPPVTLRVWSRPGRVVVTVTDAGPGPSDPFVGLLSPDVDSVHGRGLWIAHHMCSLLSISSSDDGCVVRMVADADAS